MMRRSLRSAPAPLAALVVFALTACGPAGVEDPSETPLASSAPSAAPTAAATPSPTATAAPAPSQTSTPTPTEPTAPRTPPTVPPLPSPSMSATEVPTVGPEPAYGSRYDYLVTCDPAIPMWLDDGDGRYSWESTDRWIACEEGRLAIVAMSVRFEEARLLTLLEEDIGVPLAYRTLTLSGFDDAAVAAVTAQTGAEQVDIELRCYEDYVGFVEVGERSANCTEVHDTALLTGVPFAEALSGLVIGPSFERELFFSAP